MIASTTKLNTPGPELAQLDGVHALTDVTGFGLLGHLLEVCARLEARRARVRYARPAAAAGALELARSGLRHRRLGAQLGGLRRRGRAWRSFGDDGQGAAHRSADSGGLLVACAPEAVDEVLAIFRAEVSPTPRDRRNGQRETLEVVDVKRRRAKTRDPEAWDKSITSSTGSQPSRVVPRASGPGLAAHAIISLFSAEPLCLFSS